ncbi:MAG TPA: substrate-binding domain-containing protein [Steroidobacteraceae bacterium]|jgi:phosphate transport system substrate-binding protein|nr:substrate-binding domain-containing protein [Steroidobacteraceae bacterium]
METTRELPELWRRCLAALGISALAAAAHAGNVLAVDPALGPYQAQSPVSGPIRNYGFGLGGVLQKWEDGFRSIHPGIRFDDRLPTSDAAIPALVTGMADLAPDGGEATLTETLAFYETYGYHVTAITVASGAYDVEGKSNGIVVFVNRENPIGQLSLEQLDGIFGAQRDAGMRGFEWTPSSGRGNSRNIRTWGQLGLTGEWADKEIQTYGHAPSGTTRFFQWKVLQGGDKWNENFLEYVETGSKMIAAEDRGTQRLGVKYMLQHELAGNRYGIAWTVMPQARDIAGIKPIALSTHDGGTAIVPSRQTFQDRSYPLTRDIYIFINRAPGKSLDPKLREFLRYALSREGQQIVASNGSYLPLPAHFAAEQLMKLE